VTAHTQPGVADLRDAHHGLVERATRDGTTPSRCMTRCEIGAVMSTRGATRP
jgi:hypothetical protein